MLRARGRFESRVALLLLGIFGLIIGDIPELFHVATSWHAICMICRGVLLLYSFYKIGTTNFEDKKKISQSMQSSKPIVLSAVISSVCVAVSYFLLLHGWQHFLLQLAGSVLFLYCWSLPKSSWQQLPLAVVVLKAFLLARWKEFRLFVSIPHWILIILCVIWLGATLLVFRILGRRQTNALNVELH